MADNSKRLTDSEITAVKAMYATGNYTMADIAQDFGVSVPTIAYHTTGSAKRAAQRWLTKQKYNPVVDTELRKAYDNAKDNLNDVRQRVAFNERISRQTYIEYAEAVIAEREARKAYYAKAVGGR